MAFALVSGLGQTSRARSPNQQKIAVERSFPGEPKDRIAECGRGQKPMRFAHRSQPSSLLPRDLRHNTTTPERCWLVVSENANALEGERRVQSSKPSKQEYSATRKQGRHSRRHALLPHTSRLQLAERRSTFLPSSASNVRQYACPAPIERRAFRKRHMRRAKPG
ncbi:hypothetical protein L209DRAFT_372041 [Thermothelomyces heterothallicus CBS 203.75]